MTECSAPAKGRSKLRLHKKRVARVNSLAAQPIQDRQVQVLPGGTVLEKASHTVTIHVTEYETTYLPTDTRETTIATYTTSFVIDNWDEWYRVHPTTPSGRKPLP